MGAMRKMAVYLGLVEDDDLEYADHDEYEDPRAARAPHDTRAAHHDEPRYSSVREVPASRSVSRTVSSAPPATRGSLATDTAMHPELSPAADPIPMGDLYRITTLHPRSYNDARRIGEEFREGVPVIMNLSDMDDSEAKRLVDFAAGLIFGCRGSIERVTNKVFLLSPQNVDVAAEAHRLAQDGFFNQS
jgi:cell division inhibitor SepF